MCHRIHVVGQPLNFITQTLMHHFLQLLTLWAYRNSSLSLQALRSFSYSLWSWVLFVRGDAFQLSIQLSVLIKRALLFRTLRKIKCFRSVNVSIGITRDEKKRGRTSYENRNHLGSYAPTLKWRQWKKVFSPVQLGDQLYRFNRVACAWLWLAAPELERTYLRAVKLMLSAAVRIQKERWQVELVSFVFPDLGAWRSVRPLASAKLMVMG